MRASLPGLLHVTASRDAECRYGSDNEAPIECHVCHGGLRWRVGVRAYNQRVNEVWGEAKAYQLDASSTAEGACYEVVTVPADAYLTETAIDPTRIYIGEGLDGYRLGDLFKQYGADGQFGYILEGSRNDTIGAEYIRLSAGDPRQRNVQRLKRALAQVAARRGVELPRPATDAETRGGAADGALTPTLVLHIRVGDSLCTPRKIGRRGWDDYRASIHDQLRYFGKGAGNGGYYSVDGPMAYARFGDDDYWSNLGDVLLALRRVRVVVIAGAHLDECLDKSAMYLQSRRDWLERHPAVTEVDLRLGQHPDDDVFVAVAADVFVSTGGGFGALLGYLSKLFGGNYIKPCGQFDLIVPKGPVKTVLPRDEERQPGWLTTVGKCAEAGAL